MRNLSALVLALSWCGGWGAVADDWDVSVVGNDGGIGTSNALFHGSEQVHDLPSGNQPDQDWYLASTRPFSSYQVVVYGLSGPVTNTASVLLMNASGTQVLQNAVASDSGRLRSLQWHVGLAAAPITSFVKVEDPECRTFPSDCNAARYRIRLYDTTYTVPSVDNTGTRSSVLFVQNTTDRPCSVAHHYFDDAGIYVASGPLTALAAYGQSVLATAAAFPGRSGAARVTHTCGYGGLSGKVVTTDAADGASFDTALVHRPR
jgi:hypothetical protein